MVREEERAKKKEREGEWATSQCKSHGLDDPSLTSPFLLTICLSVLCVHVLLLSSMVPCVCVCFCQWQFVRDALILHQRQEGRRVGRSDQKEKTAGKEGEKKGKTGRDGCYCCPCMTKQKDPRTNDLTALVDVEGERDKRWAKESTEHTDTGNEVNRPAIKAGTSS